MYNLIYRRIGKDIRCTNRKIEIMVAQRFKLFNSLTFRLKGRDVRLDKTALVPERTNLNRSVYVQL